MDTDLFDYELPESAIAQVPADRRDHSRLLVVDRVSRTLSDHRFAELPDILGARRARFFRNTAAVIKARLPAQRTGGGKAEILLLSPGTEHNCWNCMLRPARKLRDGTRFGIPGAFSAQVIKSLSDGTFMVRFETDNDRSVLAIADAFGQMPLPPYIRRAENDPRHALDAERYQTVYADHTRKVAAAAPTAGLHFTGEVLDTLKARGHVFHDLILHVGLGTFKPIQTRTVQEHDIHHELYEIPAATRAALEPSPDAPRIAVGTTSLRAIEDYHRKQGPSAERTATWYGDADIYIWPPADFNVDGLITNFHLPRSTLMCLVSAFLTPGATDGIEWLKDIYRQALAWNYRFYSYGDAMLIL